MPRQFKEWSKEAAKARARVLYGTRVPGEGPLDAIVALIGERPGKDEAARGRPFVGAAGLILRAFASKAGINLDRCYITNLVKTFEDRDPTPEEIIADEQELKDELARLPNVRIIAGLGAFSTRWLLGPNTPMDVHHGIVHFHRDRLIVPVYHPASGLYNTNDLTLTYWDLIQLGRLIRGEVQPVEDLWPDYAYRASEGAVLPSGEYAVDTEGYKDDPWMLSFTDCPGTATVVLPGRLKVSPHTKILMHNAPHDLPVLEATGVIVEDAQFEDTMLKAYNCGGVHPQGLKALSLRLAGMVMDDYSDLMGPLEQGIMLEYMRLAAEEDWGPKVKGDRKMPVGTKLMKAIKEYEAGVKEVDLWKRWKGWPEEDQKRIVGAMGKPPRATIHDLPEPVAINYAGRDADATMRINPELDVLMEEMGTTGCYRLDLSVVPALTRMREVGMHLNPDPLRHLGARMQSRMDNIQEELGFNPDSGDQVAVYLFHVIDLKSIKNTKGGSREATDDKVLEGLWGQHPHVPLIIEYRECSKIKSNFCQGLIDTVNQHGRISADLGMRANSGRFTCKEPNLLAIPVRSEVGKEVREAFDAPNGCVIGDWDYSQIEMRWLAEESEDEGLIEIFRRGGDVHGETAAMMFGIPFNMVDEDKHRYPAKRVGFGVITGITGRGLLDQFNLAGANRDGKWTEVLLNDMIEAWLDARPGVRRYMEICRMEARRYGYVRDKWGRVRYLPGIWAPIERIKAEAGRQSHSHKIQGGAAGLIKMAIQRLWPWFKKWRSQGWKAEILLPVHDELVFEMQDDPAFLEEAGRVITHEMQEADHWRVPIKANGAFGRNWREAKGG